MELIRKKKKEKKKKKKKKITRKRTRTRKRKKILGLPFAYLSDNVEFYPPTD